MSLEYKPSTRWQQIRSSNKFIYLVVNLAAFTDAYIYGLIVPILPYALTKHAHVQPADVQKWTGILLGAFGGGLFLSSPIAGYWADNSISRRTPYLSGLIALTASTIMYSMGSEVAVLVIARFVQGASSGFVYCTGVAILADTVGETGLGPAMGIICLSIAVGLSAGPAMGGALYHSLGYQAVFASAYVIIALDILFRVLMIERPPEPHQLIAERNAIAYEQGKPNASKDYGTFDFVNATASTPNHEHAQNSPHDGDAPSHNISTTINDEASSSTTEPTSDDTKNGKSSSVLMLLSSPRMLTALLSSLVLSFEITILETGLPLYIKQVFGFNTRDIGLIVLCSVVPYVLGPAIGVLSERWGYKLIVTLGYAFLSPLWVLLRLVNHQGTDQVVLLCFLIFAKCVALNLALGPAFSEAKAAVDERHDQQTVKAGGKRAYGMAYALMNMAYALGSLLGPILGSYIIEKLGWANMTLIVGIMFAFCVIPSILFTGGKGKRNPMLESQSEA